MEQQEDISVGSLYQEKNQQIHFLKGLPNGMTNCHEENNNNSV